MSIAGERVETNHILESDQFPKNALCTSLANLLVNLLSKKNFG